MVCIKVQQSVHWEKKQKYCIPTHIYPFRQTKRIKLKHPTYHPSIPPARNRLCSPNIYDLQNILQPPRPSTVLRDSKHVFFQNLLPGQKLVLSGTGTETEFIPSSFQSPLKIHGHRIHTFYPHLQTLIPLLSGRHSLAAQNCAHKQGSSKCNDIK